MKTEQRNLTLLLLHIIIIEKYEEECIRNKKKQNIHKQNNYYETLKSNIKK